MNPQLLNPKQPWLTLVIPTCNRPLHIAELLSKYSSMSRFSDCVLSIYDSSTGDQTKDAVSPICVMPTFIITDILLILGLLRL